MSQAEIGVVNGGGGQPVIVCGSGQALAGSPSGPQQLIPIATGRSITLGSGWVLTSTLASTGIAGLNRNGVMVPPAGGLVLPAGPFGPALVIPAGQPAVLYVAGDLAGVELQALADPNPANLCRVNFAPVGFPAFRCIASPVNGGPPPASIRRAMERQNIASPGPGPSSVAVPAPRVGTLRNFVAYFSFNSLAAGCLVELLVGGVVVASILVAAGFSGVTPVSGAVIPVLAGALVEFQLNGALDPNPANLARIAACADFV